MTATCVQNLVFLPRFVSNFTLWLVWMTAHHGNDLICKATLSMLTRHSWHYLLGQKTWLKTQILHGNIALGLLTWHFVFHSTLACGWKSFWVPFLAVGNNLMHLVFLDKTNPKIALARNKCMVHNILQPVLMSMGPDGDLDDENGPLGTLSIQNCASTWARLNGVSKDNKDCCSRWKSTRQILDRCNDIQLDWVDAKVAQELCIGGPCVHKVVDKAMTGDWICSDVTPNTKKCAGSRLESCLAGLFFGLHLHKKTVWSCLLQWCNKSVKHARIVVHCHRVKFRCNVLHKLSVVVMLKCSWKTLLMSNLSMMIMTMEMQMLQPELEECKGILQRRHGLMTNH